MQHPTTHARPDPSATAAPGPQGDETRQRLNELIDGQRLTMLTRSAADGQLHSKPMTVLAHDDQGNFWFFVRLTPGQAGDAAQYRQVNLAFSRPDKARHVSLAGQGQLVQDRARIHALWTPAATAFFPEGPDSPELGLLHVVATEGEYWDGPSSSLVRAFALAASIATGKPMGLGEHGPVDLSAPAHA